MGKVISGSLVILLALGVIVSASIAMAAKERSNEVASAIVPFEAGRVVPDLEHNIIKFRSVDILILDPDVEKDRQKVKFKMRVENFGEHDHKVIITTTLRDVDDKIVANKTVKDDIDDNDSELIKAKFALSIADVERVESVLFELSYLKD